MEQENNADKSKDIPFSDSYSESMQQELNKYEPELTGDTSYMDSRKEFLADIEAREASYEAQNKWDANATAEALKNFAIGEPIKYQATTELLSSGVIGKDVGELDTGNYDFAGMDSSIFPAPTVNAPKYDPQTFGGANLNVAFALVQSQAASSENVRKNLAEYFNNIDAAHLASINSPDEDTVKAAYVNAFLTVYKGLLDKGVSPMILGSPYIQQLSLDEVKDVLNLVKDDGFTSRALDYMGMSAFSRQSFYTALIQDSFKSEANFERNYPLMQFMQMVSSREAEEEGFISGFATGMSQYAANALTNWSLRDYEQLGIAVGAGATTGGTYGLVAGGVGALPAAGLGAMYGALTTILQKQATHAHLSTEYDRLTKIWSLSNLYKQYGDKVSGSIIRPRSWPEALKLAKENELFETSAAFVVDTIVTFGTAKIASGVGLALKQIGKGTDIVAGKLGLSMRSTQNPIQKLLGIDGKVTTFAKYETSTASGAASAVPAATPKPKTVNVNAKRNNKGWGKRVVNNQTRAKTQAGVQAQENKTAVTDAILTGDAAAQRTLVGESLSAGSRQMLSEVPNAIVETGRNAVISAGKKAQLKNLGNVAVGGAVDTTFISTFGGVHQGITDAGNNYIDAILKGFDQRFADEQYVNAFINGFGKGFKDTLAMGAIFGFGLRGIGGLIHGIKLHNAVRLNLNLQEAINKDYLSTLNNHPLLRAKVIDEVIASGKTALPKEVEFKGFELEAMVAKNAELKETGIYQLYQLMKEENGGVAGNLRITTGELIARIAGSEGDLQIIRSAGLMDDLGYTLEDALGKYLQFSDEVVADYLATELKVGTSRAELEATARAAEAEAKAAEGNALMSAEATQQTTTGTAGEQAYNPVSFEEVNQLAEAQRAGASVKEQAQIVREAQTKETAPAPEAAEGAKPAEGQTAEGAQAKVEREPTEMEKAADLETAERSAVYKKIVSDMREGTTVHPKLVQEVSDFVYTDLKIISEISGKSMQELLEDKAFLPKIEIVKEISHSDSIKVNGTYNAETNTIRFVEDADFSTFLHEFNHYFLETIMRTSDMLIKEVEDKVLAITNQRIAAENALKEQIEVSSKLAQSAEDAGYPLAQRQLVQDAAIAQRKAEEAAKVLQTPEAKEQAQQVAENVKNIREKYKDQGINAEIRERGEIPNAEKAELLEFRDELYSEYLKEQTADLKKINAASQKYAKAEVALTQADSAYRLALTEKNNLNAELLSLQAKQRLIKSEKELADKTLTEINKKQNAGEKVEGYGQKEYAEATRLKTNLEEVEDSLSKTEQKLKEADAKVEEAKVRVDKLTSAKEAEKDALSKTKAEYLQNEIRRLQDIRDFEAEAKITAKEKVRDPLYERGEISAERIETNTPELTERPLSFEQRKQRLAKEADDYVNEIRSIETGLTNNQKDLITISDKIARRKKAIKKAISLVRNAEEKLKLAKSEGNKDEIAAAQKSLASRRSVLNKNNANLKELKQEKKNLESERVGLTKDLTKANLKAEKVKKKQTELENTSAAERAKYDAEAQAFEAEMKRVAQEEPLNTRRADFIEAVAQFRMWAEIEQGKKWADLTAAERAEVHEKFVLAYTTQHLESYGNRAAGVTSAFDRALLRSYQKRYTPEVLEQKEIVTDKKGNKVERTRRPKAEENKESIPIIKNKMEENFREAYGYEPANAADRDFTMARYVDELSQNYFSMQSPHGVYTMGDIKDYGRLDRFMPFLSEEGKESLRQAHIESSGSVEAAYAKHSLVMAVIFNKGQSLKQLIRIINGSNLSKAEKEAQTQALKEWSKAYGSIRNNLGKAWRAYKEGDKNKVIPEQIKKEFDDYRYMKDIVKQMQSGSRGYGAKIIGSIDYDDFLKWLNPDELTPMPPEIVAQADRLYKLKILVKKNGKSVSDFIKEDGPVLGIRDESGLAQLFSKFEKYEASETAFLDRMAREEFSRSVRDLESTTMGGTVTLSRLDKQVMTEVQRYGSIVLDDLYSFTKSTYKIETVVENGKKVQNKVKTYDFRTSIKEQAYEELKFVRVSALDPRRYASESKRLLILSSKEAGRGANADIELAGNYLHGAAVRAEMSTQAGALQTSLMLRLKDLRNTFSRSDADLAQRYDVNKMREGQAMLAYMGVLNKEKYFGRENQMAVVNPEGLKNVREFLESQDKVLYYREMTVRDLDDVLNRLATIKKEASELYKARKAAENLGEQIGDVTKLVDESLTHANKTTDIQSISVMQNELNDKRPFWRRFMDTSALSTLKMEYFCEYVQGATNGKVKDLLYLPLRRGQTAFSKANNELSIKLDDIMKRADKEFRKPLPNGSKSYTLQTVEGKSLSVRGYDKIGNEVRTSMVLGSSKKYKGRPRTEIFGIMMHMGNESNKARAAASLGVSVDELESAIRKAEADGVITDAMWEKAQEIWDLYEGQLGGSLDTFYKLNGYYFDVVFADEFVSHSGKKFKGGYVPIVYIEELGKISPEVDALSKGAPEMLPQSTSKSQFTKTRSQTVIGKQIDLDPADAILGLRKQLRYQYLAEPVTKLYRMISQETELTRKLNMIQPNFTKTYKNWLLDVADQNTTARGLSPEFRKANAVVSAFISNSNTSALAGNFGNILTGLANYGVMFARIGVRGVLDGMFHTMGTKEIAAISPFMEERMQFRRNSVQRACSRLEHSLWNTIDFPMEKLNDFSYFFQSRLQAYLDRVVWTGAYHQALRGSAREFAHNRKLLLSDEEAIKFADATVRDTQGSFDMLDKASIERSTALTKLFIPFSSYFISMGNLIKTDWHKAGLNQSKLNRFINYSKILAFEFYLPTVFGDIFNQLGRGSYFDDTKDKGELLLSSFLYGPIRTGAIMWNPYFSPVGNIIDYATGKSYGSNALYQNMVMNISFTAAKSLIDFFNDDADERDFLNLLKIFQMKWGVLGGVTGNIQRYLDYEKEKK